MRDENNHESDKNLIGEAIPGKVVGEDAGQQRWCRYQQPGGSGSTNPSREEDIGKCYRNGARHDGPQKRSPQSPQLNRHGGVDEWESRSRVGGHSTCRVL